MKKKGRCLDIVMTGALQWNKTEFLGFSSASLGKQGTKSVGKTKNYCNTLKYLELRNTVIP